MPPEAGPDWVKAEVIQICRPDRPTAEGNRVPSAYRQVVRTFSQARAVRP